MTTRIPMPPMGPDKPWLAPLAGYSDLPFRLLCRRHGAACAVTEMVSAKGLVQGGRNTEILLATTPEDAPLVVQLFCADPGIAARAVAILADRGFAYFDLNAGCPVKKVVKTGAGAAMMRDLGLLVETAGAMAEAAGPGRVGVKMRLGWDRDMENFIEAGQRLERAGAAWLALHPRHARQGFMGRADHGRTAELVRAVSLPVLASGDLFTAADAAACLDASGAAGVMFARGALTDPRVFSHVADALAGRAVQPPSPAEIAAMIREHVAAALEADDSPRQFRKMRSFLPRYVKALEGAREFRAGLVKCRDWDALLEVAARVETMPPAPGGAARER